MRARACATLISTRTVTVGSVVAHEKPGVATFAHGRAASGAGGTGFGVTVLAIAFIRCTDKHGLQALVRV